jgi:hypothetical protein
LTKLVEKWLCEANPLSNAISNSDRDVSLSIRMNADGRGDIQDPNRRREFGLDQFVRVPQTFRRDATLRLPGNPDRAREELQRKISTASDVARSPRDNSTSIRLALVVSVRRNTAALADVALGDR